MVVSTFRWNLPSQPSFVGLENYIYLFTDAIEITYLLEINSEHFYFSLGVPINLIIPC
jgi:ABC-type sugar transport system permease subunit